MSVAQSILPHAGNRCSEAKIEESEKGRQPPGVEPRKLLA